MQMKFRGLMLCTAAAVSLAACGEDQAPNVVATGEAANAAAKATSQSFRPQAGHWDVTMTVKEMDIVGVPDGMKEAMAQQLGKENTLDACLTPEEAQRDDGKFFIPNNQACDFKSFSMVDGKLSSDMICVDGGRKQDVKMDGSYSPDSYDMMIKSQMEMNGQPVKMTMHITGKRNGECTGKEFSSTVE